MTKLPIYFKRNDSDDLYVLVAEDMKLTFPQSLLDDDKDDFVYESINLETGMIDKTYYSNMEEFHELNPNITLVKPKIIWEG